MISISTTNGENVALIAARADECSVSLRPSGHVAVKSIERESDELRNPKHLAHTRLDKISLVDPHDLARSTIQSLRMTVLPIEVSKFR